MGACTWNAAEEGAAEGHPIHPIAIRNGGFICTDIAFQWMIWVPCMIPGVICAHPWLNYHNDKKAAKDVLEAMRAHTSAKYSTFGEI